MKVYALVDTGADECAFPASFAPVLGHNLQAGRLNRISTGNGITIAYRHTTRIAIKDFTTQDVLVDFMPNLNTPLLGVKSFLNNFILTVDYPNKTFSLVSPKASSLEPGTWNSGEPATVNPAESGNLEPRNPSNDANI